MIPAAQIVPYLQPESNLYAERVTTYTIGEIAERSGFSASSLRYYEGIGLVEPARRSEAGYRLYDDHTVNRLAFIAHAKQLGCSLEDITDLAGIWDGERCGPVQRRSTHSSPPRSERPNARSRISTPCWRISERRPTTSTASRSTLPATPTAPV